MYPTCNKSNTKKNEKKVLKFNGESINDIIALQPISLLDASDPECRSLSILNEKLIEFIPPELTSFPRICSKGAFTSFKTILSPLANASQSSPLSEHTSSIGGGIFTHLFSSCTPANVRIDLPLTTLQYNTVLESLTFQEVAFLLILVSDHRLQWLCLGSNPRKAHVTMAQRLLTTFSLCENAKLLDVVTVLAKDATKFHFLSSVLRVITASSTKENLQALPPQMVQLSQLGGSKRGNYITVNDKDAIDRIRVSMNLTSFKKTTEAAVLRSDSALTFNTWLEKASKESLFHSCKAFECLAKEIGGLRAIMPTVPTWLSYVEFRVGVVDTSTNFCSVLQALAASTPAEVAYLLLKLRKDLTPSTANSIIEDASSNFPFRTEADEDEVHAFATTTGYPFTMGANVKSFRDDPLLVDFFGTTELKSRAKLTAIGIASKAPCASTVWASTASYIPSLCSTHISNHITKKLESLPPIVRPAAINDAVMSPEMVQVIVTMKHLKVLCRKAQSTLISRNEINIDAPAVATKKQGLYAVTFDTGVVSPEVFLEALKEFKQTEHITDVYNEAFYTSSESSASPLHALINSVVVADRNNEYLTTIKLGTIKAQKKIIASEVNTNRKAVMEELQLLPANKLVAATGGDSGTGEDGALLHPRDLSHYTTNSVSLSPSEERKLIRLLNTYDYMATLSTPGLPVDNTQMVMNFFKDVQLASDMLVELGMFVATKRRHSVLPTTQSKKIVDLVKTQACKSTKASIIDWDALKANLGDRCPAAIKRLSTTAMAAVASHHPFAVLAPLATSVVDSLVTSALHTSHTYKDSVTAIDASPSERKPRGLYAPTKYNTVTPSEDPATALTYGVGILLSAQGSTRACVLIPGYASFIHNALERRAIDNAPSIYELKNTYASGKIPASLSFSYLEDVKCFSTWDNFTNMWYRDIRFFTDERTFVHTAVHRGILQSEKPRAVGLKVNTRGLLPKKKDPQFFATKMTEQVNKQTHKLLVTSARKYTQHLLPRYDDMDSLIQDIGYTALNLLQVVKPEALKEYVEAEINRLFDAGKKFSEIPSLICVQAYTMVQSDVATRHHTILTKTMGGNLNSKNAEYEDKEINAAILMALSAVSSLGNDLRQVYIKVLNRAVNAMYNNESSAEFKAKFDYIEKGFDSKADYEDYRLAQRNQEQRDIAAKLLLTNAIKEVKKDLVQMKERVVLCKSAILKAEIGTVLSPLEKQEHLIYLLADKSSGTTVFTQLEQEKQKLADMNAQLECGDIMEEKMLFIPAEESDPEAFDINAPYLDNESDAKVAKDLRFFTNDAPIDASNIQEAVTKAIRAGDISSARATKFIETFNN